MLNRKSNKGFTLVEILIVVIILGILAAIVIPQFTNASQDARRSSLTSQLQTLRSQIELYKLQHNDELPNIVGGNDALGAEDYSNWDVLTQKTLVDHTVDNVNGTFGPYMQAPPKNPLNNRAAVTNAVVDPAAPAAVAACGFVYDYNAGNGTGKIYGTSNVDGTAVFIE